MSRARWWVGWTLVAASLAQAEPVGVDFLRQDIAVDVTGPHLVVDLTLTLQAVGPDEVLFDFLVPDVPLQSLEVDGVAVTPLPSPDFPGEVLQAHYPAQLSVGQQVVIHARLEGPPSCAFPGQPGTVGCAHGPMSTLLLPSGWSIPSWYFTSLYSAHDPFLGTITVKAPGTHRVVAGHGKGLAVENPDGSKTWTFSLLTPAELLMLAAGNFASVQSGTDYRVEGLFVENPALRAGMTRAVEVAAQVLPVYAQLYGPLPAQDVHLVATPSNFMAAGMGLVGSVVIADYVFTQLDYLLEQGVAHEFGHSWWGGGLSSAADELEAPFLSESLAEYSACRAMGAVRGEPARTAATRMNSVWYMYRRPNNQDAPVLSTQVFQSPAYVHVTYHKGSSVLRTLEEAAGPEVFTRALRGMLEAGVGNGSVQKLVEEVQQAGGKDLTSEVNQWLRAPGYPRVQVEAHLSEDFQTLTWNLSSQGSFEFDLPVRVRYPGGTSEALTLRVGPGRSQHALSLKQLPEAVEADPRWTLVREINPALAADVTLDGWVDANDLIEVALRQDTYLPTVRRLDGGYDPLFDLDRDGKVDSADLELVLLGMN